MEKRIDIWNETVKIRDSKKYSSEVRHKASLLLNQLNTSGGMSMMRQEVENFIMSVK